MYVSLVDYATVNFDLTILYTDVVEENLNNNKIDLFIGQQLNSKVRVQKNQFLDKITLPENGAFAKIFPNVAPTTMHGKTRN